MIVLGDLGLRLGRRTVLSNLTMEVAPGVCGLLGPNGAGKTSLLRVLATILRPTSGSVTVAGFDVTNSATSTELRRRLGYLPQNFRYVPSFTARDFVLYVAWLKKVPDALAAARTEEVLERVGLSEQAATVMRRLSGGMVRRVGIAQALVNDPQVLLLDEPTAGLDPQQRIAFRKLVRELGRDRVVLLSTHLVEDVGAACDEVHVLSEGSLRFSGSPHGLQELAGTTSEGDSELERGYSTALE